MVGIPTQMACESRCVIAVYQYTRFTTHSTAPLTDAEEWGKSSSQKQPMGLDIMNCNRCRGKELAISIFDDFDCLVVILSRACMFLVSLPDHEDARRCNPVIWIIGSLHEAH
jgi:hypothetical protein